MTENEAIKLIENDLKLHSKDLSSKYKNGLRMAINALEKQMTKKLINTCQYVSGCCPNCKKYISDWLEYNKFMCCPYCGQRIDWSDEDDK